MIAGHFATALVPYELTRKAHPVPFWFFLLAAQFLDVLMVTFVTLGIETTTNKNGLIDLNVFYRTQPDDPDLPRSKKLLGDALFFGRTKDKSETSLPRGSSFAVRPRRV